MRELRRLHPASPIWLVAREGFGHLLLDRGIVDHVLEIRKGEWSSYEAALEKIENIDFKIVVCPHESWTTARFVRRVHSPMKIGFRKWWNFFVFDETVDKIKTWPEAFRQMSLIFSLDPGLQSKIKSAEALNEKSANSLLPAPPAWSLAHHRKGKPDSILRLQSQRPKTLVCVFPGSVWKTKKWTEHGFQEVVRELSKHHNVVLMGSKQEWDLCEKIRDGNPNVQNEAGRLMLRETVEFLGCADLVISNDSGGQHLASLVNVPVLSLFGPTVLSQGFRPWVERSAVAEVDLNCRPCGRHGHQKCPLSHHNCMNHLEARTVLKLAEQLLSL